MAADMKSSSIRVAIIEPFNPWQRADHWEHAPVKKTSGVFVEYPRILRPVRQPDAQWKQSITK